MPESSLINEFLDLIKESIQKQVVDILEKEFPRRTTVDLRPLERAVIVQEVLLSIESNSKEPDFTTRTLGELIDMDYKDISRVAAQGRVYGQYKVGGEWRFRRGEILFRRSMGLDVFKKGYVNKSECWKKHFRLQKKEGRGGEPRQG